MEDNIVEVRPANPLVQLVYLVVGIISVLLALRFLFILLGVSPIPVVSFVYNSTDFLVRPFYGLFGHEFISGTQRVELEALIALVVVWIVGGIISSVLRMFR